MSKIEVLLVDDHSILIEGLRAMLGFYEDIEVVGSARDGNEALEMIAELQPEIVLLDITMPGVNGITVTQLIRKQFPEIRVLILTQHEEKQFVLAVLKAGASGYILKRALGTDLINAIHIVALGGNFLYPSIATLLVEEMKNPTELLTPRELEVLIHISQGESSGKIAENLSLSIKTVEWHRNNLMSKLKIHNVADLVRFTMEHGLI